MRLFRYISGANDVTEIFFNFGPFKEFMMSDSQQTTNWPDLAIGLYDRLTGRNAEITYELDDMHVQIPSGTGPNAEHAEWIVSGALKIRTQDLDAAPN